MRYPIFGRAAVAVLLFLYGLTGCKNERAILPQQLPSDSVNLLEQRQAAEIKSNLEKLKQAAQDGDLVARLTDDFVSEQLRMFNEKDKAFSHSGVVITKNGEKTVCSILPGLPNGSPVVYAPIDSFLNPVTTVSCGLFRYNLSAAEKAAFISNINSIAHRQVYFDSVLNIKTDDSLYCSEMIYKGLQQATHNRLHFRLGLLPPKMQATVHKFYRGRLSKETIAHRQVMFIDNLYLIPQCTELMRFRLKYFLGQ